MRSLTRCTVIGLIALAAGLGAAAEADLHFFLADGSTVPLRLVTDEIVLERADAARPSALMETAGREFGTALRSVRSIDSQGRLAALDLATSLSAADWLERARRLHADQAVRCAWPVLAHPASGHRVIATDEILVSPAPGSREDDISKRARPLRLREISRMEFGRVIVRYRIENPEPFAAIEVSNALYRAGLVQWAEPNFIVEIRRGYVPTDPQFYRQWHLHNTGQSGGVPDADIDAVEAWDITRGSPNVVVAILDDGMDLEHPDLHNNIFVNPAEIPANGIDDDGNGYIDDVSGWDFLANDNHPGMDSPSTDYHATPCAGLVGAIADNGRGVAGVAPAARILPCRIVGREQPTVEKVARAIQYAGAHADVLSMSWTALPNSTWAASLLHAATAGRGGLGCALCAATGNDSSSEGVGFPASLEYVMGIGASNAHDVRARYSNYAQGYGVFLLAPSGDAGSAAGVVTTLPNGNYGTFAGTSAATPQVAGVCALLLSLAPGISRAQVEAILRDSADKINPANAAYGPDGYSWPYGYGRVNACRALVGYAPDLVPVTFDFQPDTAPSGGWVSLSGSVRNAGPGTSAAFWVEFWLSRSPAFATLDLMALPSGSVPPLGPGEEYALDRHSSYLLSGVPDGYYRLGVVIDRINEQAESNESNNALYPDYRFLQVGAGSTNVDLAIEALDFSPTRVEAGEWMALAYRVTNRGVEMSRPVWAELWVSAAPAGETLDHFLCDSVAIAPLGPGESVEFAPLIRTVYGSGQGLPGGRYRVGLVLDRQHLQRDVDLTNNRRFRLDKWLTVGHVTGVRTWTRYR